MPNDQQSSRPLTDWLVANAPDCGDNSCLFGGRGKGGMRTNGGCRCFRDLPTKQRIYIERMQAALSQRSETGPSEDTKRLDWLDKQGSSVPFGWIARGSTTGRGFRLHQEPTHHFGETHQNVRDAIDAASGER